MTDRFSQEQHIDTVSCANCGAQTPVDESVLDEHMENYFCDRDCFYEWLADNAETVAQYYQLMNEN